MSLAIDAHQHVWDPATAELPWMSDALAAIRRPFGLADLAPELAAAGLDGTIVVQAQTNLDESRELLGLAATSDLVRGVVAWVDVTDPAVADVVAALRAEPGGNRLVGIRHPVHDEPDPDWLRRSEVRRGIAVVGEAGLAFDLLVRARELPAAIDLVRDLPDVRFVLDHLAKPPIATGGWEPWATSFSAMGSSPNVSAKLSGLVTEARWDAWTVDDLRPYADHAIRTFGPARLLFGSDWPVCRLAASYSTVVAMARALVSGLSTAEQAAVFGTTAARAYRLDPGS